MGIDNIYVINYIIKKQLRIGKKVVIQFVKSGIRLSEQGNSVQSNEKKKEGLIERVKKMLSKTKSMMRGK